MLLNQKYKPEHKKFYDDDEFHFKDKEVDLSEGNNLHEIEVSPMYPGSSLLIVPEN